uniref:protein-synthesizing GTPase n=1 Tax=Megaviridae environmental sample TaxID=1737588 RepID=A0A5J6VID4_9VIRU|nr:MAG: elongation factor Tu GTP binding domain protein [Megaviridae environmental sample]
MSTTDITDQPTFNVGMIGHVSHGKSTVIKALTGETTTKFKQEMERNITIKLGYANARILTNGQDYKTNVMDEHQDVSIEMQNPTESPYEICRHISFVDCPGHDILMATMLSGASVMDAVCLVISANEDCPQPQTEEHLAAITILQDLPLVVLQNKIDLVDYDQALRSRDQIETFLKNTIGVCPPIIPISAVNNVNMNYVCQFIANIPTPLRNFNSCPEMTIVRSYNINKQGVKIKNKRNQIKGGVLGGSITKGTFNVGDQIKILPGIVKSFDGVKKYRPLETTIVSIYSSNTQLTSAIAGGLIACGVQLDPAFTIGDRMIGNIITGVDVPNNICIEIIGSVTLIRKYKKALNGSRIKIIVGSLETTAKIKHRNKKNIHIKLDKPTHLVINDNVPVQATVDGKWKLVGYITVEQTVECEQFDTDDSWEFVSLDESDELPLPQGPAQVPPPSQSQASPQAPPPLPSLPIQDIVDERFYRNEFPNVGDFVMVKCSEIAKEVGLTLTLMEYGNKRGFAALSEMSRRRRIRSIKDIARLNQTEILQVITVDEKTNCIDLSKRDIEYSKNQVNASLKNYHIAKRFNNHIRRVSKQFDIPYMILLQKTLWVLYDRYETPTAVAHALQNTRNASDIFYQLDLENNILEYLVNVFKCETKQDITLMCNMDITCLSGDGVDIITNTIEQAFNISNNIKITMTSPPHYIMELSCRDLDAGVALLNQIIRSMRNYIRENNGYLVITQDIHEKI